MTSHHYIAAGYNVTEAFMLVILVTIYQWDIFSVVSRVNDVW